MAASRRARAPLRAATDQSTEPPLGLLLAPAQQPQGGGGAGRGRRAARRCGRRHLVAEGLAVGAVQLLQGPGGGAQVRHVPGHGRREPASGVGELARAPVDERGVGVLGGGRRGRGAGAAGAPGRAEVGRGGTPVAPRARAARRPRAVRRVVASGDGRARRRPYRRPVGPRPRSRYRGSRQQHKEVAAREQCQAGRQSGTGSRQSSSTPCAPSGLDVEAVEITPAGKRRVAARRRRQGRRRHPRRRRRRDPGGLRGARRLRRAWGSSPTRSRSPRAASTGR